jgi:hypothetical protein
MTTLGDAAQAGIRRGSEQTHLEDVDGDGSAEEVSITTLALYLPEEPARGRPETLLAWIHDDKYELSYIRDNWCKLYVEPDIYKVAIGPDHLKNIHGDPADTCEFLDPENGLAEEDRHHSATLREFRLDLVELMGEELEVGATYDLEFWYTWAACERWYLDPQATSCTETPGTDPWNRVLVEATYEGPDPSGSFLIHVPEFRGNVQLKVKRRP